MSKIRDARVHPLPLPLVRPFGTAVRIALSAEAVLVQVVDSEGRSGWGEAAGSGIEGLAVSDD